MNRKEKRFFLLIVIVSLLLPFINKYSSVIAADVTVNFSVTKQVIDGFGASSAWCGAIDESFMTSLYGDLGYSILRLRIEEGIGDAWKTGNFNSWKDELANAKKASAKGAIVFASPWNPPKSMQENFTKTVDASAQRLKSDKYSEYVDYLNTYVKYMKDNGVELHAISVQNEPDYAQDWNWWTPTEMLNFVENYADKINCRVIAPESYQYLRNMSDPILNSSKALANMEILGFHLYGTSVNNFAYPLFEQKGRLAGKKAWMTEHYVDTDNMSDCVKLMKELHDCMVTGNMNGYVYWWITWPNGLVDKGAKKLFKRAYVLGQFAKYVRPGYYRVDATATPTSNVLVSAYTGDKKMVVVAVNTGNSSVNQKFVLQNGTASQLSTWQTTSSNNMTAGQSVTVAGGSFSANLPAQSITTFVGPVEGVITATIPQTLSPIENLNQKDLLFTAGTSNRKILITPSNNINCYNLSIYNLNGTLTLSKNSISGVSEIQVKTSGMYIVNVQSNGHNEKKMVSLY